MKKVFLAMLAAAAALAATAGAQDKNQPAAE
jgi:hypothetical protein